MNNSSQNFATNGKDCTEESFIYRTLLGKVLTMCTGLNFHESVVSVAASEIN